MVSPLSADMQAHLVVDARCQHGEGVIWDELRQQVMWVDIDGSRLWLYDPAQSRHHSWALPDRAGCVALADDGSLLLALAKGLYHANLSAALSLGGHLPLRHLVSVERDVAHTRVNDGRADRHGNFVFGTMNEHPAHAPTGAWYQYSSRHGLRKLDLPGVAIPNSTCFSPDGLTLYYCDSVSGQIMCCDYDASQASVRATRRFTRVEDHANASPDGSCIDMDGFLWNAQWGASRVVRYRPDGTIDRIVSVPVPQPSCCALGGAALDTLYVITSPQGLTPEALAAAPSSGGLFAFDVPGCRGLVESRVRLE